MALSCLLSKVAVQNCLKGQTLRTSRNLLVRSTSVLCGKYSAKLSASETTKSQFLSNAGKLPLLPASFMKPVGFASQTLPEPDYKKHSHVMIWRFERVLAAALLPLIPASLIMPSQILDTAVAVLVVMHTHWGLEAIVVDYIRPILFGNLIPKIGLGLLYVFSVAMLAGLLNLIYNDLGLANSINMIVKS